MGDAGEEQDADPIKASYDVYIKPHLSSDREMYILQFPNRDARQHYKKAYNSAPLKMRIKPNAGMVEMDVPMDVYNNYDRQKGQSWGDAMKKSASTKGTGTHGLPGGFGIGGAPPPRGRGRGAIEDPIALQKEILEDYKNAVAREEVLVKQTLGGQAVPIEETSPHYMIGTFHGSTCTWFELQGYVLTTIKTSFTSRQSTTSSRCALNSTISMRNPNKNALLGEEIQHWVHVRTHELFT